MDSVPPSNYLRTVYDETLRSKQYINPALMSMASRPNLIGHLEYHSPTTDGSFSIAVASGEGVFISKALLDSIPAEHPPTLDTTLANQTVETFTGTMKSIGTAFIPFILTNNDTREQFRIVLYAIVLPNLFLSMFIGTDYSRNDLITSAHWFGDGTGPLFGFNFGEDGKEIKVKGIR